MTKYKDLADEIKAMWQMNTVEVIPSYFSEWTRPPKSV
jgi:hypothetical protein